MRPTTPTTPPARILVVEDDFDTRDTLSGLLERAGYEVISAADGAEAITALEEGPAPDFVLADLHMPGIVGHEVLEYMQSHDALAQVPVAIITAAPEQAPAGYRVFKKPASFQPLLDFIRGHAA